MGRISAILCLIIFLSFSKEASAQTSPFNSTVSKKTVEGLTTIAQSIISDTFSPMTHYKKGDLLITSVPAYFDVKKIMDDPEIETDNLKGRAFGLGMGYAFTDRMIFYLIGTWCEMDGTIVSEVYGNEYGPFEVKTNYSFYNIFTGFGYDLFNGKDLSIPVYLGIGFMSYETELKGENLNVSSPPLVNYTLDADVYGNKDLLNLSAGITFSYNIFESLKTSVYYLYTKSLTDPEISADINQTGTLNHSGTENYTLNGISSSMIGLNITYRSSKAWSFSLNAGSSFATLTGFNNLFNDGMELYTIVASVTFTTSFTD